MTPSKGGEAIDFSAVAKELVRAMRGAKSQVKLSEELGNKNNVLYQWEAGRGPNAARFFELARHTKVDIYAAVKQFFASEVPWLSRNDAKGDGVVAKVLEHLQGDASHAVFAERVGSNRYTVRRWTSGDAQPSLVNFLRAIQTTTRRLLEFIAVLDVNPLQIPSVAAQWAELQSAVELAYELPWSHAVLRAMELTEYSSYARYPAPWIAKKLSLPVSDVESLILRLAGSQLIELVEGKWCLTGVRCVDTRVDPEKRQGAKRFWMRVAEERIQRSDERVYSYLLGGVSREDFAILKELQRRHFREVGSIIRKSSPVEVVLLTSAQLLSLEECTDGL